MRKIGGHVSIAGGISNAIDNTISIGGNCMQIFAGSPRLWARTPFPPSQVEAFLARKNELHLDPIFIHALYLVNLATDNQDLLEKSINSLIADLNNGTLIESAGVIVHIGSHQGRGFDSAKKQIIESINKILSSTTSTNLILENDAGQNGKIGSIEEIETLVVELKSDRIRLCLDTAHLFESGTDLRNKDIVDLFVSDLDKRGLLEKISCIHLNDSATELDSHRDNHANIGEGKIGSSGLSNFINHPRLSHLPLLLEVPGENKAGPDKTNIERVISLTK